jgi:hypothetical protein
MKRNQVKNAKKCPFELGYDHEKGRCERSSKNFIKSLKWSIVGRRLR